MKQELIKEMIKSERLKLTGLQTLDHYFIVIFLLFLWSLTAFSLFEIYVTKNYHGVSSSSELLLAGLSFLLASILSYFIQHARLNFFELTISHSETDFEEALKRTKEELKWGIGIHQKKYIRAFRPSDWTGSWGEMITIIKDGDRILLNSICDPDKLSSIFSFGWNRKNLKTFSSNLKGIVNKVPIKYNPEVEIPENEWTLKKIIMRLFTYPFCIFLILLGFYMIIEPVNYKSAGAGIGGIIIASSFLYYDLKIITTKKTKSTNA